MAHSLPRLKGIEARPLLALLRRLAELGVQARAADPAGEARLPRVRLDLPDLGGYEGYVLGLEERTGGLSVLFLQAGPANGPLALAFLDVPERACLTVLDAGDWLDLLRFGQLLRWSADEPLPSLQLRRHLEQAKERLGLALALEPGAVAASGPSNNVLRDLVDGLCEWTARTRSDALGAAALQAVRGVSLRLSPGSALACTKEGAELVFALDPQRGLPEKAAFFEALDRLL